MKKSMFLLFAVIAVTLGFTSCSDDDEAPVLGAYVGVTVKNLVGANQEGVKVYMFKDLEPNESTDLSKASEVVTTNESGLARFKLNFAEFGITESETNLYFAVYYNIDDTVIFKAGDGAVTVKRDEEKVLTITIPI